MMNMNRWPELRGFQPKSNLVEIEAGNRVVIREPSEVLAIRPGSERSVERVDPEGGAILKDFGQLPFGTVVVVDGASTTTLLRVVYGANRAS